MNPAPNLVFVGPMGAGKTTIGTRVAAKLALRFVDIDQRLQEITGARVPLIFECEGEAGFRARESALIAELCSDSGLLIATGGGAVLDPANRAVLRERGFVVHLHLDVDAQLARLARDHSRPLLASGDRRVTLTALAAQRDSLYAQIADLRFDSNGPGPDAAARRLAMLIADQWQRNASRQVAWHTSQRKVQAT
ncbi:MAG TPA: shikimate kinase [Xanthomonadaceae bacterium]|jgi:shikimate kinase|nr:shikimate kinase [Xanthomonadaceae bacterium]